MVCIIYEAIKKIRKYKEKKLKMHKKRLWGGRDLFPLYGVL